MKFFLSILGHGLMHDSMLEKTFKSVSRSKNLLPDKRGKQPSMNKFTDTEMKSLRDHILSHNPTSHYHWTHAPNRLYLSAELIIQSMLDDYNSRREKNIE